MDNREELISEIKWLREKLDRLLLKQPTGPRGQVVTLADCVETNEGYRYALLLQEAEKRELDLLAKVAKLEKLLEREKNAN